LSQPETFKISSLVELREWIRTQILPQVAAKQIFLISGPMAAGKTELVKQFVELLGGETVTSPSFALHNTYPTHNFSIEHLDLFRLESEDDLASIGFWDLFENEKSVILIEWAEKINPKRLPMTWQKNTIEIKILSDQAREITFLSGFLQGS
jgi:tRNA threonylcarbamoyladenosine biosynthesis protein TsaE